MKALRTIYMAGALLLAGFGTGCNDFLDEDADNVFTQHQIFSR